jgi:hypothetical protein
MMRRDENKKSTLMNRAAVASSIVALVILFISGLVFGQSSKRVIGKGNKGFVEKVREYPDSFISFENYEEVPLLIQEAKAKEIGKDEYYQLTGLTTDSTRYTSFPNLMLMNNTNQRIIGVTLAIANRQTRQIDGVKLTKISIDPYGSFSIEAGDFIRPERIVRVTESGKVINRLKPDLDSEKMWLRGKASDLVVIVGMVEFENGNIWMMDPSKDPW